MKVAILLSGCGIGDGSQIEEVILTYLALDKYQIDYVCFAPDRVQIHTYNHLSDTIDVDETRNILIESARIGRGRIFALKSINYDEFDALIIPGGQGVFKNLSDYFIAKDSYRVDEEVDQLIKRFYVSHKPIGAICGASLLVGRSLLNEVNSLYLSTSNNSFMKIFENKRIEFLDTKSSECLVDKKNKVISTPAFIGSQNLYEIMHGIDNLVKNLMLYYLQNVKTLHAKRK